MFYKFIRRGGYLALILVFMGLVAVWVWWSESAVGREFATAERLTGTVSRLHSERRFSQNSTYVTTYYVTVISPAGRIQEDVSGRFYNSLSEGDQIEIRRLPGPPERIEVEPGSVSSNALAALLLSVLLLAAGGALSWFIPRNLARARDLQANGILVEGEILGLEQTAFARKLHLRYTRVDGTSRETSLPVPHLKGFGPLDAGARHPLRYHPENPEQVQFQVMLDWLWPTS